MEVHLAVFAEQNIKEAHAHYLGEANEEVADNFYFDVSSRLRYISNFQEVGSLKYASKFFKRFRRLRFLNLKKFPYLLFFRLDEDKKIVTVEAILHEKRDIPELLQ